jgi:hypothetical protein
LKRREKWKAYGTFAVAALAVGAFASPAAAVSSMTTAQATPSTATTGQSVDLSATVACTGDPSGGLGMTFFDGSDLLTTVPVGTDGTASYDTSFATAGAHTITAAYNGNANCDASNGTTIVQVTSAPTPPPSGLCLLVCGSLIDIKIENVGNVGSFNNIGGGRPGKSWQGKDLTSPW